jgi:tetratricopeptide (TPR) repeat protein
MLRLSLSLAASGSFEGRPLADWAARLLETEPSVDWEELFDMPEDRLDADLKQGLAAASFVRFLIEEGKLGPLKQLYRNSREGAMTTHFRALMGESLSHAAQRWSRSIREGDPDTAEREAGVALSLNPRDAALLSWAHVTRGRAEAMRGHLSVAALELRDPAVGRGPEGPRLLADLWLESLGLSPNRKVVEEQLRQEARADLQNFDWDGAEKKLLAILSANPHNPEAHFQLSQVYLSKHNTWMERAQLVNELHPSTSMLDPEFYNFLADRADVEMRKGMALSLPEYAGEKAEGDPYQIDAARLMKKSDLYDPSLRMEGDSPLEYHPHFFRGRALFFASDWARAREELRLSLSFDGGHQRIVAWDLVYLGFVDHFTGDGRSACAHFEAARRLKMGGKPAAAARKGMALAGGCKGEESTR